MKKGVGGLKRVEIIGSQDQLRDDIFCINILPIDFPGLRNKIREQVRDEVREQVQDRVRPAVRDQVRHTVRGAVPD